MKRSDCIIWITLVTIAAPLVGRVDTAPTDDEGDDRNDSKKENNVDRNTEEVIAPKIERIENIIKSPRDPRSYRGLKLGNELSVLLISDPDTDKAAACMTVGVGSMHDHKQLPGLAHFLEHMLFMGSEKYPAENHFFKFITEHAGSSNGSTYEEKQDYYWNIAYDHLEEILDIFAQFFLKPRMDPSCTDREVNAVDSEFSMDQTKDSWRISQLEHSLSKPDHPHNNFNVGNLKSLSTDPKEKGIDVREKLLELYETRYSANLMYLAVLGKESLDDLEKMVVPRFKDIINKKLQKSIYTEHPWGPEQLKRRVRILSISDMRLLRLRFPMPEFRQHYKAAPMLYITTLIGHEGLGSISAELRRRGWTERLTNVAHSIPGFSFLDIDVNLTKEAMDHIDDVVKIVFQYIYMLKNRMREEPQKWIFDEIKRIQETKFEYAAKSLPLNLVVSASASMMNYPFQDVLSHEFLIDQWDPSLIQYFLDYLRPDNMSILLSSKSFEEIEGTTQTEPWYGIKYNVESISDEFIDKMWKITELDDDKFHLPPRNEFIASNFQIYPLAATESKHPRVIHESSKSQFWFKQDEEFKLPRMSIRFIIYSPWICLNQENDALAVMYTYLFTEKYTIHAYAASLAGLSWKVHSTRCGLQIKLFGYHEKLPLLLENLLLEMKNFMPDEEKFEIRKDTLTRWYKNFPTQQPYDHGVYYIFQLQRNKYPDKREYLASIERLQMRDMDKFVKKLFSRVFIQGLVYGNCDEQLARQVVSVVENSFESASIILPQEVVMDRGLEMEDSSTFTYTTFHKHSASSGYFACFQIAADSPLINVVLAELYEQFVTEKCFQVLRTEEQLGYVVWCGVRSYEGVVSFEVVVQSDKHPAYVDSRVEVFLRAIEKTLEEMTKEEEDTYKTSLINTYMEKIVDQSKKSKFYWKEIADRRYLFDKNEQMSELVKSLGKNDMMNFYKSSLIDIFLHCGRAFQEHICESCTKRRKLAIYVISKVTNPNRPDIEQPETTTIQDVVAFKNARGWFPVTPSVIEIAPVGAKV